MNEKFSFSIVICTYNRANYLKSCLESLKKLNYGNFEVIVVNGPSTDDTERILKRFPNVKVVRNPIINISISRNLGIKVSSGEIVAFIDDDAIPEPEWLSDLAEEYTDEKIGGAGGKVYGPGGDHFQFSNGIIDIWGYPLPIRENSHSHPDGFFNIMMGTNSSFRKKILCEVGGFDENYEYYHDESDLAVRIIKKGYVIKHHPKAYVHHEFAKGHIRKSVYDLNWYPVIKNTIYFGIKNSNGDANIFERVLKPFFLSLCRIKEFTKWYHHANIDLQLYGRFIWMWFRGIIKGYWNGFFTNRKLRECGFLEKKMPFRHFNEDANEAPKNIGGNHNRNLSICLLSQQYPPTKCGGVGIYTCHLANEFSRMGHNVHVITKGNRGHSYQEHGIHIHQITPKKIEGLNLPEHFNVTQKNLEYSYSVHLKLEELITKHSIDVAESPLWDVEGLVFSQFKKIPIVVRLETPLKKAIETQKWGYTADLKLSCELEKKFIESADGIIAISDGVKNTISEIHKINFEEKVKTIPLGIPLKSCNSDKEKLKGNLKVLFVGRLERRKGIDTLLEAIPLVIKKVPNAEFYIVGDDTIINENGRTYVEEFKSKYKNNELKNKVFFLGFVNDENLQSYYKSCDVFVAPSRYESFGLILLEAMTWNKPVIGCNVGGMPEIIEDGETGYLVPPGNPEILASRIIDLLENEKLRIRMGNRAGERMKNRFTLKLMADKTIDFYREIILKREFGL